MMVLRGSTGPGATEAGGVADLIMASGGELAHLQRRMTGKHSHFELKLPWMLPTIFLRS